MNILLGVVISGTAKQYAVAKFEEMCRVLLPDINVIAIVDMFGRTSLPEILDLRMAGSPWATEIVYYGKETLGRYALTMGYDAVVWQGVDCYYQSRSDFDRLAKDGEDHPIVGGLIAGRSRPDYAVCREFIGDTMRSTDHHEKDHADAFQGLRTIRGYIGSDATLIRRDALETVSMDGYQHWHETQGEAKDGGLGPEEYFMWSAINHTGIVPVLDARVRPYHAHEDGWMARYPGQQLRLRDLHWDR